jgi:hypothetical protein
MAPVSTSVPAAVVLKAVRGWRLFPCRTEIDRAVTAAHPAGSTGCRWLMPAAEMAGLAGGSWRPSPEPAAVGWACPPRMATRALGAQAGSVRAARDFTVATLRRWGTAHSSQDIAIVVSEMVTNALRHALPGPGGARPRRPVRLGLLHQGPWVLCAVADPSEAVPVPRTLGSLAEAGRGLQMICAFSDLWGYTTPGEAGKVVWAMFTARHAPPSRPGTRAVQAATRFREQHADDRDQDRWGRLAHAEPTWRAQSRPAHRCQGGKGTGRRHDVVRTGSTCV